MRLMKVFGTSSMPQVVWEYFHEGGGFVKDGFWSHTVGWFVKEAADDPDNYDQESVDASRLADQWLISQGATDGEIVLIEHGGE